MIGKPGLEEYVDRGSKLRWQALMSPCDECRFTGEVRCSFTNAEDVNTRSLARRVGLCEAVTAGTKSGYTARSGSVYELPENLGTP